MRDERLNALRRRGAWDLIDEAFVLYRDHFAALVTVSGALFLPVCAAALPLVGAAYRLVAENSSASAEQQIGPFFLYALTESVIQVGLFLPAAVLQTAATALVVASVLEGAPIRAGAALRRTFGRIGALLGLSFILSGLALAGYCTAGLLNLGMAIFLALAAPVVLLERSGPFAAMGRSLRLVSGALGLATSVTLLSVAVAKFLEIGVGGLVGLVLQLTVPDSGVQSEMRNFTLQTIVEGVARLLIAPVPAIASTLLYFRLRLSREAMDLEKEALRDGVDLAPDYFSSGRRDR